MENKQPTIWAVLWVTFIIASYCLSLRIMSRFLKKAHLWWDDFFAIGTYVVAIAWLITCPIWMANGLGMHIQDVTWLTVDEALSQSKLILYVAEIIYAFGLYFAKMSILFFYWRLFNVTSLRWPILILMGMSTVWIIIRTFMAIFHCVPVRAFWDLSIKNARCNIDDKKFFFGSVLVHLLLDVMILSLPVLQIGKLQLKTVQKLGIMFMFLFGFLICVCAIAIVIATTEFDASSSDLTWNIADIVIWATAEVNLVTVSACFPTIRPAFMHLFGRWVPGSLGSNVNSNSKGLTEEYAHKRKSRKSIKLDTMMNDHDEQELTFQGVQRTVSDDDIRDLELQGFGRNPQGASHTTIRGQFEGLQAAAPGSNVLGISIKTETSVRISESRDRVATHLSPSSRSFA